MQSEPTPTSSRAYTGDVADLYDLIHEARGKDYRAEAKEILRIATEKTTNPESLLDVACGTGLHLKAWKDLVAHVEGVDLSPDMCSMATNRLNGVKVHEGDMRELHLGRRFDVVTCLFSSIGHLPNTIDLEATFRSFALHLEAGGTILVEPWWFPDRFIHGYVSAATIDAPWGAVSRVSHSVREEGNSTIEVHYLVAERGRGITQLRENHVLSLFTLDDHLRAFEAAGLSARYIESSMFERGIFVAHHSRD